ncbi:hypothetical protein ACJJTC_004779 [Scirpophaga incertulas]
MYILIKPLISSALVRQDAHYIQACLKNLYIGKLVVAVNIEYRIESPLNLTKTSITLPYHSSQIDVQFDLAGSSGNRNMSSNAQEPLQTNTTSEPTTATENTQSRMYSAVSLVLWKLYFC